MLTIWLLVLSRNVHSLKEGLREQSTCDVYQIVRRQIMVSKKIEDKEKPAKELVPRKKLQSVPDLLANGPNEEGDWESLVLHDTR